MNVREQRCAGQYVDGVVRDRTGQYSTEQCVTVRGRDSAGRLRTSTVRDGTVRDGTTWGR